VVRAVHKSGSRLVINETPNRDQWNDHAVRDTCGFDRICVFSTDRHGECKGTTRAVKVTRILLSKGQYLEILHVGIYCLPRY
jgi:hypothetical protein